MIYNMWLAFKYRPRLSVWGKIVVWWVVISLPWMLALAWYTATGQHLEDRFEPIVSLSILASAAAGFFTLMIYYPECEESPNKWRIFREGDE